MIILCFGLPSSASTWAYNVVRSLSVATKPQTLGVFAQTARDLQQAVPPGTSDLILKAHTLDEPLFRLIEASNMPVIMTWRDPRDAAVSMAERTGIELGQCIADIQRSASVLLSLLELNRHGTVVLEYGQDYMNKLETIHDIARSIGTTAPSALVRQLHETLKTSTLKKSIDTWSKSLGPKATFSSHVDMDTHWHKNHLGDGRSGKWREVATEWERDLDAALSGYQAAFEGCKDVVVTLPWQRFSRPTRFGRQYNGDRKLYSNGMESDLHLPRGWWTATFDFDANTNEQRVFECSVECDGELLAQRLMPSGGGPRAQKLTFEHTRAGTSLRFRIAGLDGDEEPTFGVSDVRFGRVAAISPVGTQIKTNARRVSTQVLPSA